MWQRIIMLAIGLVMIVGGIFGDFRRFFACGYTPANWERKLYCSHLVYHNKYARLFKTAQKHDIDIGDYVRPPAKVKPRSEKIEQVRVELAAWAIQAMQQ
jgi:hypothetical protein